MKMMYVYILFNHSRTLYIGVTSNLIRRMDQHRRHLVAGFTAKYNIAQLAYYEAIADPMGAIRREKQLKGWNRAKKIALIESVNSQWDDLSVRLIEQIEGPLSLRDDLRSL